MLHADKAAVYGNAILQLAILRRNWPLHHL